MERTILRSVLYVVLACSLFGVKQTFKDLAQFQAWFEGHPFTNEPVPTMPLLFATIALAGLAGSARQAVENVGENN
jgi:hypothetical protein